MFSSLLSATRLRLTKMAKSHFRISLLLPGSSILQLQDVQLDVHFVAVYYQAITNASLAQAQTISMFKHYPVHLLLPAKIWALWMFVRRAPSRIAHIALVQAHQVRAIHALVAIR